MRDKYIFVPVKNALSSHVAVRDEVKNIFDDNKAVRKAASGQAIVNLKASLAVAATADQKHTALHAYERDYLSNGGNWAALQAQLQALVGAVIELRQIDDYVDVLATVAGNRSVIGTVHLGGTRFIPAAVQPFAHNPTIYVRVDDASARHYIFLPDSQSFVRRFVTRGLNAFDGMNLTQGQPMQAVVLNDQAKDSEIGGSHHNEIVGAHLTINQQILSHTRGWGGNKRFISTGISNRPAFSTRGTEFLSMYGAVVIDLARVPLNAIYDLHTPERANQYIGLPATNILNNPHHTGTNDLAEETYLSLRDVIRTRELLVHNSIPYAAVQANVVGVTLLGVGSQTNGQHAGVEAQINAASAFAAGCIVQHDHMTFRDPHTGLRWHVTEYASTDFCQIAANNIAPLAGQRVVRFNKYSPQRPPGMV